MPPASPAAPAAAAPVNSDGEEVGAGGAGGAAAAGARRTRRNSALLLSLNRAASSLLQDPAAATDLTVPLTAPDLLLDSCVGDEYDKELPYDAAQLAALASSKPYTSQSPSGSSRSSSSMQHVGSGSIPHTSSMLSLLGAAALEGAEEANGITPLPHRDQRPSQFACSGRYQILSVDDDPVNQIVVQSLLASTGYEVVCQYSGQQMLDYLDSAAVLPDLILLDMLMPDMSG